MLDVSRREFEAGWSRARHAYETGQNPLNNAHRLLLFYAVENGLKAIITSAERAAVEFSEEKHNLNKLMDRARVAAVFRLPRSVRVRSGRGHVQRNCGIGELNQLWRYGCIAEQPTDNELEASLKKLAEWIERSLEE